MSSKLLLSPSEAAAALGVGRNTVYDLLHGELSSFLIGNRRKIPISEIEQYIARQIEEQGTGKHRCPSLSQIQKRGDQ